MTAGGWEPELLANLRHRLDQSIHQVLEHSSSLGFLGGMPVNEQIDHALGFVAVVEHELTRPPQSVLDLGTGGGVPGLVLAWCWPTAKVVLLDSNERRTEFLTEVMESRPAAGRAVVVRARAEEAGHRSDRREEFEVVTSRSFGMPSLTAECGSAFLRPGGLLIVSEPPVPDVEERWPEPGLARLSLVPVERIRIADRYGYQIIRKVGPLDARYPRRVGVPVKRPLF